VVDLICIVCQSVLQSLFPEINVRIMWCEPKKDNTGMGKPLVENKLAEVVVIGEKYPVFLMRHCKNFPVPISAAGGFLVNTELIKNTPSSWYQCQGFEPVS
jgi:hypothetical protein